jgi:hypothetical protein
MYDLIDTLDLHREVTNRANELHRAAADRSLLRCLRARVTASRAASGGSASAVDRCRRDLRSHAPRRLTGHAPRD